MTKKLSITFCLVFLFISLSAFSNPFGFRMGMTYDEIGLACNETDPVKIERTEDAYFVSPVKTHPFFIKYIAYIDKMHGLYRIQAISNVIPSYKTGKELKKEFYSLKERLEKIYGSSILIDGMVDDSASEFDATDDNWLYALNDGFRELSATWDKGLKNDLLSIKLKVYGDDFKPEGRIVIDYKFNNKTTIELKTDKNL